MLVYFYLSICFNTELLLVEEYIYVVAFLLKSRNRSASSTADHQQLIKETHGTTLEIEIYLKVAIKKTGEHAVAFQIV